MGVGDVDVLHDSRISHCKANLNGRNYRELAVVLDCSLNSDVNTDYLLGIPEAGFHNTIFLVGQEPSKVIENNVSDPRLAGSISRMEIANTNVAECRAPGCVSRSHGVWRHGKCELWHQLVQH